MEKVQYMVKAKESGNEEVIRERLMDKVDCLGSELSLIKYFIGIICFFEFFNILLYYTRRFLKTIQSEENSFKFPRSFQTEERSKMGEKHKISYVKGFLRCHSHLAMRH
jgi:hypothetical protein